VREGKAGLAGWRISFFMSLGFLETAVSTSTPRNLREGLISLSSWLTSLRTQEYESSLNRTHRLDTLPYTAPIAKGTPILRIFFILILHLLRASWVRLPMVLKSYVCVCMHGGYVKLKLKKI
jgi:hypothetical protein